MKLPNAVTDALRPTLCALAVVVLCAVPGLATFASDSPFTAYVTGDNGQNRPEAQATSDFGCEDKVFTVIEADNAPEKSHAVVVRWVDPAGKERERTETALRGYDGVSRIWSWLKLHRGAGASLLSIFDPAAGLEGFIGNWQVFVSIDQHELPVIEFGVLC